MDMDKTDVEIVKTLLGNSRLSAREVARNSGVSVGTVISRTKILENEGVIKGYAVMMDHEKLGYELTVVTEIIVSKGKLLETDREIAKIPNVVAVYDVTGESDAVVIAKFKSREELSGFTKKLLSMPYVERTNTHVVLTTVKEDFRLLP